jgi:Zn-dependent peptidase ImmA (M78 family)
MNASAAGSVARPNETKVCPVFEPALDVVDMKAKRKIKQEAECDAARILSVTLSLDIPVDSAAIANELGVSVLVTELEEGTLGGLLMEPGEEPEIHVNRRDGYLRQRLTCALELGHYLQQSAVTNKYARLDHRRPRSDPDEKLAETYAHEFATSLLMPKRDVEVLAELGMDDLELALRLMVPREAMQLRLKGLGLPAPELETA